MKTLFITCLFLLSSVSFAKTEFGEKISLENPLTLAQAIKADAKKEILIKGKVATVCKKKGCWLSLADDKEDYRVTFKDYAFFVPFSLKGKNVLVQGKIKKKTLSLEDSKHYVEDEGGDPDKVTEPITEYRIVASGLKVVK